MPRNAGNSLIFEYSKTINSVWNIMTVEGFGPVILRATLKTHAKSAVQPAESPGIN